MAVNCPPCTLQVLQATPACMCNVHDLPHATSMHWVLTNAANATADIRGLTVLLLRP